MKEIIYVFVGGGVGSVLRFLISIIWRHLSLHPRFEGMLFPWPTFIANVLGCLMIGMFYHYGEKCGLSPEARLLLTTGLCGGFTTFSTFSYEGVTLINAGCYGTYLLYVTLSIILGIVAAAMPLLLLRT